jgi:uncharacterized membrane protein YagU involved in acid resistance
MMPSVIAVTFFMTVILPWPLPCREEGMPRQNYKLLKGIMLGTIGGLAGSFVMNQFQALLKRLNPPPPQEKHAESGDDATVKTAEAITETVAQRQLSNEEKKKAGPLVHYAYGATIGAVYGAMASQSRKAAAGFGTAYGAAAWALGDEVAVPALKLGAKPTETPLPKHLEALASHLVYGATLEGVRRLGVRALRSVG